ncbi:MULTISPECIES: DUF4097 family beta strand repeat-containing protein [Sporosarcina]|uniref:DUF4097 family beta strand repeat-containing protein n=1 Tax=Sporosarcina contaminans TaxID=633403 RepID=A0ABW3U1H8_9BACL
MNENQFIYELEQALKRLPADERDDIILDIKEYFSNGREDGKSEEEIAASLGSPNKIASELLEAYPFNQEEVSMHTTMSEKMTIPDNSFTKVDIDVQHGALFVSPSDTSETTVELIGQKDKLELTADVIGETLKIRLKNKSHWLFLFNFHTRAVALNVFIPKKVYESVAMKSDNGRIKAQKLIGRNIMSKTDNGRIEIDEVASTSLTAETDNGRIVIKKVQTDRLKAKTDNGRIHMRHIEADSIYAESDNGRLEFVDIKSDVTGVTDNGRITLQTEQLNHHIDFQTDNGSIEIQTDQMPENATIIAKTGYGKIDVYGERNTRTRFGSEQYQIRLKSDNGRITVK